MKNSLIAIALACVTLSTCEAQTYIIDSPQESASGFNTSVGFITAGHVTAVNGIFHDLEYDFKLSNRIEGAKHRLGTGDPDHFFDRRGHKVKLDLIRKQRDRFVVKQRFFSGESGLPIFNSRGEVVGLVIGFYEDSKNGIISRFETLTVPIEATRSILSLRRVSIRIDRSMTLVQLQKLQDEKAAEILGR